MFIRLAMLTALLCFAFIAEASALSPAIHITYTPPYGTTENVKGNVANVVPADYMVAVYIYTAGWWTKPTFAHPLTTIGADSQWECNIVTGGNDRYSTKIAAFLLPAGVTPPQANGQATLPSIPEAVASDQVQRGPAPRVLQFGGYDWTAKSSINPVGPGPNYFSDQPEAVWTDTSGQLHLTVQQTGGQWRSTEIILNQSLGYGEYVIQTSGRVDLIDPQIVCGMFTWDDDSSAPAHREMDIELSRWRNPDNPNNAQYVVQPFQLAGHRLRYNLELSSGSELTYQILWSQGNVLFRTYRGQYLNVDNPPAGDLVNEWTCTDGVPDPGAERFHFNLWLINGDAPTNGTGGEVVVAGFAYRPAQNSVKSWSEWPAANATISSAPQTAPKGRW